MDTALPTDMVYVIDGGCLLHRLAWTRGHTVEQITQLHVQFVQRNFGRTAQIISDGYSCGASMKDHEHRRRSGKAYFTSVVAFLHLCLVVYYIKCNDSFYVFLLTYCLITLVIIAEVTSCSILIVINVEKQSYSSFSKIQYGTYCHLRFSTSLTLYSSDHGRFLFSSLCCFKPCITLACYFFSDWKLFLSGYRKV